MNQATTGVKVLSVTPTTGRWWLVTARRYPDGPLYSRDPIAAWALTAHGEVVALVAGACGGLDPAEPCDPSRDSYVIEEHELARDRLCACLIDLSACPHCDGTGFIQVDDRTSRQCQRCQGIRANVDHDDHGAWCRSCGSYRP